MLRQSRSALLTLLGCAVGALLVTSLGAQGGDPKKGPPGKSGGAAEYVFELGPKRQGPVYEYRSGLLIKGTLDGEGNFVPEAGSKVIPLQDYLQGYDPKQSPRIYNLPGRIAKTGEQQKEPRPAKTEDYIHINVEARGTLVIIEDKLKTDLKAIEDAYLDSTGASLNSGHKYLDLYISKDLLKTAREFDRKQVVLAGTLLLIQPGFYQRVSQIQLQPRPVIQVTSLKAADAK